MDRSSHELTGGNSFLLAAIAFLEPGLGLSDKLQAGIARSEAMLRTAARLEAIDPPASVRRGEAVVLSLRVTNETGHKLPTGYPIGRRVWLSVDAPLLSIDRGRFDDATGEPIDPFAIYEAKHGQSAVGAPGYRLALNDTIYSDTRIPPRGMVPTATTAPVGRAFAESAPGVFAGWDELALSFTVPCDPGLSAIPIEAALWYQAVPKAYVDALVAGNGATERGTRLQIAFEEVDPGPIEMERLALSIAVDPASSCDPPDAGSPDTGAAGADAAGFKDAAVAADSGGGGSVEDGGCACGVTARRGAASAGWLLLFAIALVRRRLSCAPHKLLPAPARKVI